MSRRTLAVVILVWTLVSWGGRIGLLQDASIWDWARIVGSLVIGIATTAALMSVVDGAHGLSPISTPGLLVVGRAFSVWTVVIWMTSLFTVWSTPNTSGFRAVHSLLAIVWFSLAILTWRAAQVSGFGGGTSATTAASTSSADR